MVRRWARRGRIASGWSIPTPEPRVRCLPFVRELPEMRGVRPPPLLPCFGSCSPCAPPRSPPLCAARRRRSSGDRRRGPARLRHHHHVCGPQSEWTNETLQASREPGGRRARSRRPLIACRPSCRGPQTDPCERVCGCLARSGGWPDRLGPWARHGPL